MNKIQLGCLAYGIITDKGRGTCITNEVMSSTHGCVFQVYFCEFDPLIRLANCKAYTQYCPLHPDNACLNQILYSPQKPRCLSAYTKCHCKLCVKDKPSSLKSLCVNKLHGKSSNNYRCIKKWCFCRKIKSVCSNYLLFNKRNLCVCMCCFQYGKLCLSKCCTYFSKTAAPGYCA